jgi:hypothetical protein
MIDPIDVGLENEDEPELSDSDNVLQVQASQVSFGLNNILFSNCSTVTAIHESFALAVKLSLPYIILFLKANIYEEISNYIVGQRKVQNTPLYNRIKCSLNHNIDLHVLHNSNHFTFSHTVRAFLLILLWIAVMMMISYRCRR